MARPTGWMLTLALAYAVPAAGAVPCEGVAQAYPPKPDAQHGAAAKGPRERWKWWIDNRAELGLTDQQSAEIGQVFESTVSRLRALREELDRLDAALAELIAGYNADPATVAQQVDKVESARAEYNKTRTLMLYRMDRVLTAEQRAKVKALHERRDAERRKQPDTPIRR
jgi:Spy/CpxP family protein refolding chaperone